MKKIILALLLFTLRFEAMANSLDSSTIAHNTSFVEGVFDIGNWARPFWADTHSTITTAEYAFATNNPEYDWAKTGKRARPYIFANLGIDVPIWAGTFADKKYGFSLTLPYFINVWLDMFERTTAPVINTSYRFGLFEFNYIQHLDKKVWGIKNYSLKYAPIKHECSHIGDELTIMRGNDDDFSITRVNVSYNYWQLEGTINDPVFSTDANHSFKLGFIVLYDKQAGWYNIMPQEGDVSAVVPSKNPFEGWVQYQYQSSLSKNHFQWVASVEVRGRSRYHYPAYLRTNEQDFHWEYTDLEEFTVRSANVMFGVRYRNPNVLKFRSIGLALRAYHGINPYGQFRSIPSYTQLGISLVVE